MVSWDKFAGPRRSGHMVVTARTAEWLAERDAFVKEWGALQERGLREGFLDNVLCDECGGEVEPTTSEVDRTWVYDDEAGVA